LQKIFKFLIKRLSKNSISRSYLLAKILSFSINALNFDLLSLFLIKTLYLYRQTLYRINSKSFPFIFFFKIVKKFHFKKKKKTRMRKLLNRVVLIRYTLMQQLYGQKNL